MLSVAGGILIALIVLLIIRLGASAIEMGNAAGGVLLLAVAGGIALFVLM